MAMAKVDLHYFYRALDCAQRQGRQRDDILNELGMTITPEQRHVDGEQMTQLVQAVWSKLDDEFLGCTPAPCKSGAFTFMAKHVFDFPTLGKMLQQGSIFYNLVTSDIQMRVLKRGDQAELEFVFKECDKDPQHFFLEFWLIIWHRFASWLIDVKIPLTQVCFTHAKPDHWQEVKLLFPCRHHYNRPRVKICFAAKYLDLTGVRTHAQLTQFLRHSPADLITIPGSEQSVKATIKQVLLNQDCELFSCPSLETLAGDLNISGQTLRRRLKVEGTSYPQIKDQIRRDLAIDFLLDGNKNVNQISEALGFSEPRSFTRAFKQWTGMTPSHYAQQKRDN